MAIRLEMFPKFSIISTSGEDASLRYQEFIVSNPSYYAFTDKLPKYYGLSQPAPYCYVGPRRPIPVVRSTLDLALLAQ